MVSQRQTIKKLWAGHKSAQTDRQTEWFLYTPLTFVHGGYKKLHGLNLSLRQCWWSKCTVYNTWLTPACYGSVHSAAVLGTWLPQNRSLDCIPSPFADAVGFHFLQSWRRSEWRSFDWQSVAQCEPHQGAISSCDV